MPRKFFKRPVTVRRVKNWILSIIGLSIIFTAISFTLARAAIRYIPDYTQDIERIVSEQLGVKVEVGYLDAEIDWLVPRLNLFNVNILDKNGKQHVIYIKELGLTLDWISTFKTRMPAVGEIILVGLNLQVGIDEKSQFLVQNFVLDENVDSTLQSAGQFSEASAFQLSENLKYYANNLNFKILESQIYFFDKRDARRSKLLKNFNLLLINNGDEHAFEIKADLPQNYGEHVRLVFDLAGDLFAYKELKGQAYLSLQGIQAAPWLNDYWHDSGITADGKFNGQAWLSWQGKQVTQVQTRFSLQDLALHYLGKTVKTWELEQLDARARWQLKDHGWQLDVRDLVTTRDGKSWPQPSALMMTMSEADQEISLQADFLRIEGFTYLMGMVNTFYDQQATWLDMLEKHAPTGDLKSIDLTMSLKQPENIKLQTYFNALGFKLPGLEPRKVDNLRGKISFAGGQAQLNLDSLDTRLSFNTLFKQPIDLSILKGQVNLSRDKWGWQLYSSRLQASNEHIKTISRIDLSLPYNEPELLDLTVQFSDGNLQFLEQYLPEEQLGADTYEWLKHGIKSGKVTKGGFQYYGSFKDYPFLQLEGVSHAVFEVENVRLDYLQDWPEVKELAAKVRVDSDSLQVAVHHGKILQSEISDASAYIANFISPTLDIKGNIKTQLNDIPHYILHSGLKDKVSSYINNVELSGEGELGLELFFSLENTEHIEWGGVLSAQGAQLKLKKENYLLTDLSTRLQFADDFMEASSIEARLDNQPLQMNLFSRSAKDRMIYHFGLKGELMARSVLAPLPVAKKYFDGMAFWDVELDIISPKLGRSKANSVDIRVVSDLQGVKSDLPGVFFKPAESALPFELAIKLQDSAVRYQVNWSDQQQLALEKQKEYWTVNAQMPSLKGVARMTRSEKVIEPVLVELEYFDINKFLKLDTQTPAQGRRKEPLIPRDIPSIELKAKQLIWKNFSFNHVSVHTEQTKLGMTIKDFELIADHYTARGKGSWSSGWNKQHTTSIEADITVADLGAALKQIKLTDDIVESEGTAIMRWKWNDVPYRFDWKHLQGDGSIDLQDGTINKINAGAGRVLGLLNFETLLSLDFADQMSEGFAFDSAKGSFSFSNGNAYTDDFFIESKIADFLMSGKLDIDDRTVDQTVIVYPNTESTVTLGTTVVAGPTIGGLVYLFQKLFVPDKLSAYEYSIKGDIAKPVVELVSVPVQEQDQEDEIEDF